MADLGLPLGLMDLLYSTFVTNKRISRNNAKAYSRPGSTHRIGRFLSSIRSLKTIPLEKIKIYFKLDTDLEHLADRTAEEISRYLPSAEIHIGFRLEKLEEWRVTLNQFSGDGTLLLMTNDDHALVQNSYLLEEAQSLMKRFGYRVGAITHFPEMIALRDGKLGFPRLITRNFSTLEVDYLIGTCLVETNLIRQSFEAKNFLNPSLTIVRPDNPFGESARIQNQPMLIPHGEIFRHLDGYSHIGKSSFFGVLENSVEMDIKGNIRRDFDFEVSPNPKFAPRNALNVHSMDLGQLGRTSSHIQVFFHGRESTWVRQLFPELRSAILSELNLTRRLVFFSGFCLKGNFIFQLFDELIDRLLRKLQNQSRFDRVRHSISALGFSRTLLFKFKGR